MGTPEADQERQRLTSLYASLSEAELRSIVDDGASLTEMAREILGSELLRRGLSWELGAPPAMYTVEQRRLVTIRQFRDLSEAMLAKGRLDSAGIESFIGDDNMVRMNWFLSDLVGGIKLRVSPEETETASELLDQPIPETLDVEGLGEYQQPHCPKCKSMDITFEPYNKPILYASASLVAPVPIPRNVWKCHSCGHTWRDSTGPPSQDSA